MKKFLRISKIFLLILLIGALLIGCDWWNSVTPSPHTPVPTEIIIPTPESTSTSIITPTPTYTPIPSPTLIPSPIPSIIPSNDEEEIIDIISANEDEVSRMQRFGNQALKWIFENNYDAHVDAQNYMIYLNVTEDFINQIDKTNVINSLIKLLKLENFNMTNFEHFIIVLNNTYKIDLITGEISK